MQSPRPLPLIFTACACGRAAARCSPGYGRRRKAQYEFLILVEFAVEIRPVAAFGGGDAACAACAHAVVEVAVVFGVLVALAADARILRRSGFMASVAQAEEPRSAVRGAG